jgi:hypothetical protein
MATRFLGETQICTQTSGQWDICDMNRAKGRNGVAICDLCVKQRADAAATTTALPRRHRTALTAPTPDRPDA